LKTAFDCFENKKASSRLLVFGNNTNP